MRLFTCGPAGVIGIDKGSLQEGKPADITIIDPEMVKTVDPRTFKSKGRNTPYKGMELKGWPCMTLVNGILVAQNGEIVLKK